MKRNILRAGRSSLAISLPKEFIMINKIKPKQEVYVEHHGTSLHIRCESPKTITKILDIAQLTITENQEKLMDKILGVLFKQGADHFTIKCADTAHANVIRDILRKGKHNMYEEPSEDGNATVEIHCSITGYDETSLNNIAEITIKQIYRNFDECINTLKNSELKKDAIKKKMLEIAESDRMIGEQADICRRMINKNVTDYKSTVTYNFIDKLEKIGDAVRDLAIYSANNSDNAKKYCPLLENMRDTIYAIYLANSGFSIKKINAFYVKIFSIDREIERCSDKTVYYCMRSLSNLVKTAHTSLMTINM